MKLKFKIAFVTLWLLSVVWMVSIVIGRHQKSDLRPVESNETQIFLDRFSPSSPMVVEVGDIECPACQMIYPKILAWRRKRNDVRFEFVHLPLKIHPNAMNAAIVAELARPSGKFQAAIDDFMLGKTNIDPNSLDIYLAHFASKLSSGQNARTKAKEQVEKDIKFSQSMNVSQTPTIFGWDGRKLYQVMSMNGLNQLLN